MMEDEEYTRQEFMYGYSAGNTPKEGAYNLADRAPSTALQNVIDAVSSLSNDARVLNLGCGDGVLEGHADKRNYSFTSIDIEPAAIKTLASTFKNQAINDSDVAIVGNVTKLDQISELKTTQFDAAISWRVLHGIAPKHYQDIFQQVRQLLKPGTSFYISMACDKDWKAKALGDSYDANGVNDCTGVMFRDFGIDRTTPFPVHFFNESELTNLGTSNGFDLESITTFEEPSGYAHLQDRKNTYLFAHFVAK